MSREPTRQRLVTGPEANSRVVDSKCGHEAYGAVERCITKAVESSKIIDAMHAKS